jgi:hypothetical protein
VFSICREVVAGKPCITVVPQEDAGAVGRREILVARSFQSALSKAMDLAGWSGPVRLASEEPAHEHRRPCDVPLLPGAVSAGGRRGQGMRVPPSPVGEGPGERAWDQPGRGQGVRSFGS